MLRLFSYQLPYKEPFTTAEHTFTHRQGLILHYSGSGVDAFGEVAPLPGFSEESLEQVREILVLNREHLQKAFANDEADQFIQLLDQIHQCPSLSFGLDMLNADLKAKKEGLPLSAFLHKHQKNHHTISSNAILSIQEVEQTLDQAAKLKDKGYTTFKLKVGRNFSQECEILSALRNSFPDIHIRIDANQAWETDEAIENLKSIASLNIEYCEQPVSASETSALKKVRDHVEIPIAADESARNKSSVKELIEYKAADLIILKPMLMGSLQNIYVTKQLADTHNINIVCTTSLESAVGRSAVAAIAAGLATSNKAQGLSTGSLFEYDVSEENWLNYPHIEFPEKAGLGLTVHLDKLEELT